MMPPSGEQMRVPREEPGTPVERGPVMGTLTIARVAAGAIVVVFLGAFFIASRLTGQAAIRELPPTQPPERGAVRVPPPMSPEERARRFQAGPLWDGKGKGSMTQADLDSFGDYPLFWLGETFGGFNLYAVNHIKYARSYPVLLGGGPNTPPTPVNLPPEHDEVTFTYGDCTPPPGASACSPPVSIIVEPGCQLRPEWVADRVKGGPPEEVRGRARLQRFGDGHVQLWFGRVTISIYTSGDPALIDQAVQQLRGVGRTAGVGPGDPLDPPDFGGC